MPDLERVIAGLEHCITDEPCCGQKYITCQYTPQKTGDDCCARAFAKDVLALLKEQEAVVRCKMTNQEWLGTLSPETWWEVVWKYVIHNYGARFTDTRLAVIDWLKQEHEPIKVLDSMKLIMPRKEQ